eukprot:3584850-Prymnesium_polylepis.1
MQPGGPNRALGPHAQHAIRGGSRRYLYCAPQRVAVGWCKKTPGFVYGATAGRAEPTAGRAEPAAAGE